MTKHVIVVEQLLVNSVCCSFTNQNKKCCTLVYYPSVHQEYELHILKSCLGKRIADGLWCSLSSLSFEFKVRQRTCCCVCLDQCENV